MPTKLTYKVVRNYLTMEIAGGASPAHVVPESKRLWNRMGEICHSENKFLILANMRLKDRLPIRFAMDIAKNAQDCGWSPNCKLAFVTNSSNHMTLNLVKSFMVHLGYEVEVFLNKRTARKWLLAG